MKLGHSIRLYPNQKQTRKLVCATGVARFTYNWALCEWKRQYRAGEKPTANKLKKEFNQIKSEEFPFVYDSPKDANQEAFADLGTAYKNFFESRSGKRKGPRINPPKFKRKGVHDAFYVSNDLFRVRPSERYVTLPKIGRVAMAESLRFEGKILGARVFRKADLWFISVQVDTVAIKSAKPIHKIVGVDLGIATSVMPSIGKPFRSPKALRTNARALARLDRAVSRKQPGSQNRKKARIKKQRKHLRVANIRKDFVHKTTTSIVRDNQTIVIENLGVADMLRDRRFAKAISDESFGMFKIFMKYKAAIYQRELIPADRWYPSSKRCSGCGNVNETLSPSVRTYSCDRCGLEIDRDLNAAKNLEQYPRLSGNRQPALPTPEETEPLVTLQTTRLSSIADPGTELIRGHL